MATALFLPDAGLHHLMPPGHPESVARLRSVQAALSTPDFAALQRLPAPMADPADLLRAHPQAHLDWLQAASPAQGLVTLDGDTFLSPGSLQAALHAVGAACAAVDRVLAGQAGNAFVAARPPGHHAEPVQAMGFCLLSTVAIAAKHALDHHGLTRVAVVDFDVHHGNGSQAVLWDEPRVLFVSSHQMPLYPGSGAAQETGAHGNVLNLPLRPGSDGAAMRQVYDTRVWPRLAAFDPELILVSAGFDAHGDDPLGGLDWEVADFGWLTRNLCEIAARHCGGRLVSVLEGGYNLTALAAATAEHVRILMEHSR